MEKIRTYLKTQIHSRQLFLIVFALIIAVGIFLRTYHFHDWLLFEADQVRDVIVTGKVVSGEQSWPLLGPTMLASGETEETLFRIGPMYYYFQIVSAMVFGVRADVMAYPDLFFNILLLPLFFYFLRRYFSNGIALFLTSLLAISFFAIKYSRFAWNPNLIPFFVILFFIAAYEFLMKRELVSWMWVSLWGVAFGVGVQLHATTLLFLCVVWGIVATYLLVKKRALWKKLLAVLVLALFINSPQIVSEWQTKFSNTQMLLASPVKSGQMEKESPLWVLADTISCQIESSGYLLSSLGQKDCNYSYVKALEKSRAGNAFRETVSWPKFLAVLFFSFLGYCLLGYRFRTEQESSKKQFLGLIIVFSALFFMIMLPVIGSGFKDFRYFGPVFFVPYVLLGIIMDFFLRRRRDVYFLAVWAVGIFLITANILSLYHMASRLSDQRGNDGHAVFLGEVEHIVRYIKDTSESSEKVYVMSEKIYTGNIFPPAVYVAKQYNYNFKRTFHIEKVPEGAPLFFIAQNRGGDFDATIEGIPVKNARDFGEMRVYQLEH